MKIPFTKSNGGNQSPASLIAALVLVALVPAVCVLWFMSVAMRNERLAVQERLAEVYLNQLATVQRQVTAFWRERQAALQVVAERSPAPAFAAAVHEGLADSVVIVDGAGKVVYPHAVNIEAPVGPSDTAARALQAQAAEFLRAGRKEEGRAKLVELTGDPNLRGAVGAHGALIVPNGRLLLLKLLHTEGGLSGSAVLQPASGAPGTRAEAPR